MYTTTTLIFLFSYIGTITSAIVGTLTAKKMELHWFLQFLSGISAAFFGEVLLRDLILLKTTPTVCNNPLEIVITIAVCILSIIVLKHKEPGKICLSILCILDSIGIVGSVTVSYNQSTKSSILVTFVCAFVTVCGDDILTTAIQTIVKKNFKPFFTILTEKKWYYLFAAFISVVYGILHFNGHNTDTTIIVVTFISIIIGFVVEGKGEKHKR